jgi:hypothetical protein
VQKVLVKLIIVLRRYFVANLGQILGLCPAPQSLGCACDNAVN